MITVHACEQGTPEWQELRRGRYTGSNAHKLLKYGAIEYALTAPGSFGGNFWTKRGHLLEDEAIELYDAIQRRQALRPGFITNSEFPTCGYSPDGIDGATGWHLADTGATLLEVKCFHQAKHLRIAGGEIPLEVLAQIHFGLLICGLRKARLIVYNPELDPKLAFKMIEVRYNRNIANNFKRILGRETVHAQP